jgi:2-epi-5-epi-valiolone synthase
MPSNTAEARSPESPALRLVTKSSEQRTAWALQCETRRSYRVRLCESLLASNASALPELLASRTAIVVTTPTVNRLYGVALRAALNATPVASTIVFDVREETKSLQFVEQVCREALSHGLDRRGVLIAFGGGVCSDIVSVAASLIRRGIAHVRVPTTLVGQIDAGIGLKGAVNFAGKKSFLGCFHAPEQVLIDPAFLRTLPARYLAAGLAEALKMGIARDARLFELIERSARELVGSGFATPSGDVVELLDRSISSMLDELGSNPFEDHTYERLVDFGHTFSSAVEAALSFEIHHGEAVAIDLALSTCIAETLGVLDRNTSARIIAALRSASLPIWTPVLDLALCHGALAEACRHRGGAVNLVVPCAIGRAAFLHRRELVSDEVLEQALTALKARAREGQ